MDSQQLNKTSSTTNHAHGVKQTRQRNAMLQFLLESKQQPADKDKLVKALAKLAKVSGEPGASGEMSDTILTA